MKGRTNMDKNIFLIGFMGAGKSTVARVLSDRLNMSLVEMDSRIVKEQGMSINEIFEKFGENHFRDIESKLVMDIKNEGNKVVSCGGGVVVREENVACMKENGTIVFLSATPETIYNRVKDSKERPILNGNMNIEYISGLMEKRRTLYEGAADIKIDTDKKTVAQICEEIESQLK